jgi:hypothetical protein
MIQRRLGARLALRQSAELRFEELQRDATS